MKRAKLESAVQKKSHSESIAASPVAHPGLLVSSRRPFSLPPSEAEKKGLCLVKFLVPDPVCGHPKSTCRDVMASLNIMYPVGIKQPAKQSRSWMALSFQIPSKGRLLISS